MSRLWLILVGISVASSCKGHDTPAPARGSAAAPSRVAASPVAAGSDRPALPTEPLPPADAAGPTLDQKFDEETVDGPTQQRLERELGKHLEHVPNVKGFECRQTQCRIVLVGKQADVGKSIDALESAHELHTFARNIILTAPTVNADSTVELHAFAQIK